MDNYEWFRAHLPSDGSVQLQDMTGKLGVIGLWGPHAKDVLRTITGSDILTEDFRYLTFREISIGPVPVLALRVSFVGESGVELYVPWESGPEIWDKLLEAGRRYRLIPAGLGTYGSSMRLEKGYRLWGGEVDLNIEFNLVEAGLFRDRPTFGDRASKVKRPDFIGKSELLRVREEGVTRRLCCMILRDPSAVVLGSEPMLDGEQTLGYVTGADYGYSVGQSIAYGYLPVEFAQEGAELKIEYFGARLKATVVKEPLYDPENLKLRA